MNEQKTPVAPAALSPIDSATYLGVSRATLDRLRKAGEIRACKIRGSVVFRVATLDAYLEKSEVVA